MNFYNIPIPQTKIILGVGLSVGTFLAIWYCMVKNIVVDQGMLSIVLGFITALFVTASVDYNNKRKTDLDFVAAKEAATPRTASVAANA